MRTINVMRPTIEVVEKERLFLWDGIPEILVSQKKVKPKGKAFRKAKGFKQKLKPRREEV